MKNNLEIMTQAMKEAADKILNDSKSIHAPCDNAYKDNRDGINYSCPCWRCKERFGGNDRC